MVFTHFSLFGVKQRESVCLCLCQIERETTQTIRPVERLLMMRTQLTHQKQGGTIRKGRSALLDREINISTCLEARGAYTYGKLHAACPHADGTPATPADVLEG